MAEESQNEGRRGHHSLIPVPGSIVLGSQSAGPPCTTSGSIVSRRRTTPVGPNSAQTIHWLAPPGAAVQMWKTARAVASTARQKPRQRA